MTTTNTRRGELELTTAQLAAHPDDARYAWLITEDRISDGDAKDVMGPSTAHPDLVEAVQRPGEHRIRFRMYDDDGGYYYGGYLTYDPNDDSDEPPYGPLRDFGLPDAGAVRITYPDRPDLDCA